MEKMTNNPNNTKPETLDNLEETEKKSKDLPESEKSESGEMVPEKKEPEQEKEEEQPEKIEEKQPEQIEQTKEEKEEKEEKEKIKKEPQEYTPEEIKEHFWQELKKIQDLPNNTDFQKQTIYKESLKLIEDWLPFGHLDDFKGIDELIDRMDENRPKTVLTFNYRKEKLAQKVAQEMAFQYKFWNKSDGEKIETISGFIDKWLKDNSYYYQGAEKYKDLLQPPEEMGKPTKIEKWFTKETSTLLKLLGERDRTLKQVCEILAMEGVPYQKEIKEIQGEKEIKHEVGIRALYNQIENQNIKRTTGPKLRKIEEMTKEERLQLFTKTKKELGVLPKLPLKLEYYESLVSSILKEDPEKAELAAICASEILDKVNQKEGKEQLAQMKEKAQGIIAKEQIVPKPEAVQKAKEHLEKKKSILSQAAGLAGYGLLLFLVLVLLGEIKLGEKITGASTNILQKK